VHLLAVVVVVAGGASMRFAVDLCPVLGGWLTQGLDRLAKLLVAALSRGAASRLTARLAVMAWRVQRMRR
jgi:hypothetical protein